MNQLSCLSTQWSVPARTCPNGIRAARYPSRRLVEISVKGVELKSEFVRMTLSWRDDGKRDDFRPRVSATVMQSRLDLIGKNIVVVGLGASGRAAVKLALARGADVVAVDVKSDVKLPEVHSAMASRLRVELGPHNKETFHGASQLVLSPGVSAEQADLASAIQAGIPAISELSFAAEALPKSIKIAAVSGTNGKSTVTTFAGQDLEFLALALQADTTATPTTASPPTHSQTIYAASCWCSDICGWKPRRTPFRCCPAMLGIPCRGSTIPCKQTAIVEVSSYQMELPGTFRPKVAVILNLSPNHLERHKTIENYGLTKCRLFAQMDSSDLAVVPQADSFLRKLALQSGHKGTRAWLGGLPGVQLDSQARRAFIMVPTTGVKAGLYLSGLKAVGSHNAHNAGSAALLALALDLGLDEEAIQDAIPSLAAPPHRMEIVHQDEKGILWVNDSKATTVDATVVGVKGITGRQAVVLIGGLAKVFRGEELGFDRLVIDLNSQRAVVLFGASGKQIETELRDAGITVPCVRADSMKDAVDLARSFAMPGDVVLLSPACASFDEFQNFEHRGQVFTDLAKLPIS